jgi:outer membrane protein insertion porin family
MSNPKLLKPSARTGGAAMLLVLLFCAAPVASQTGTPSQQQAPQTAPQVERVLPSYEGQTVTSVELAGHPNLDTAALMPLVEQKPGTPFSQSKVNASVAALKKTARFRAVELEIRPEPRGVRVLFVLQPAQYFGIYEFPGADRFLYSRLLQVTNYPPRGAYTPVDVDEARAGLEKFLRQVGFFEAKVTTSLREDKAQGLVNVYFNTTLGRRAKFGKLTVTGAPPPEAKRLEGSLHGIWARLKSAAVRRGETYKYKTLQNATQYLENELTGQGYLGAAVKLAGASYDPKTNRADITYNVSPGPKVHVEVRGAHLWGWDRNKLLPIYQQAGLGPELIQEGRDNLVSYFQSKGYFNTRVTSTVQQQPGGESIVYSIEKGPRRKVDAVKIAGNRHIPASQLLPAVKVESGGFLWFSHGKYSAQLVRTSVSNIQRIYKAEGYTEASVTPEVKRESDGDITLTLRVNEGPQDVVQSLKVEGNQTVPESQLEAGGLRLGPGKPYSVKLVDEDRNRIVAHYLQMGYLNASFRETASVSKSDPHKVDVVYHITEGPRVITSDVYTLGRRHTRESIISRSTQVDPGKPLREGDMLRSEDRLYNLGIFDWAEVDPRRTITTQHREDAVVKVHEAKRNAITYGFGFEVINRGGSVPSGTVALPGLPPVGLPSKFKTSQKTFWGPTGTFEYTRKNMRGRAETFNITGFAGRLDQRGLLSYSIPHFRGTNWSSNASVSGEHDSQNPIFTSRQGAFGFEFQRPLNLDKTTNLFLRYNFRETGLTRLLIPDLVSASDRHVRLSIVEGSYVRDTRDNVLNATKGIYESFVLDLNPSQLGSNFSFARFLGQAAYYKNIYHGIIWANSLRLGLEQPFSGSHVPLSEKFFSGGGSTLRGFPLNGAGPQETIPACGNPSDPSTCAFIQVPTGGNQLFILNSEFRIPIPYDLPLVHKNLGVVGFYDGGNVYQSIGFHDFAADYTNSVGFGLRYNTPVGPIRIDIGHNLNALPGITSTQIFVTLGQAF